MILFFFIITDIAREVLIKKTHNYTVYSYANSKKTALIICNLKIIRFNPNRKEFYSMITAKLHAVLNLFFWKRCYKIVSAQNKASSSNGLNKVDNNHQDYIWQKPWDKARVIIQLSTPKCLKNFHNTHGWKVWNNHKRWLIFNIMRNPSKVTWYAFLIQVLTIQIL